MKSPTRDNRSALRVEIRITVVLKDTTFDGAMYFYSTNISANGVFVESNLFLQEGVIVKLQFLLPDAPSTVEAIGRVTRVEDRSEPHANIVPGLGIEFLEMSAEHRAILENFTQSRAAAQ